MDTAVIKSVEDTGKTWQDFKKVKVTTEDGRSGIVNAKSFPPPYGVGDTVEIKATWPDGNLKSISKVTEGYEGGGATSTPQNSQKASQANSRGNTGPSGDRNEDIIKGMCFTKAIETLIATEWQENGIDVTKFEEQVAHFAKSFRAAYDQAFKKGE